MPTEIEWKACAAELDQLEEETMESERFSSRIIGFWLGAVRAVTICPNCPAIVTETEMREFREMMSQRQSAPQSYCPICPICLHSGFIYLEQPKDREWIWLGPQEFSIYFHGWKLSSFMLKVGGLYPRDCQAYRNILKLREAGFKGHV